MNLMSRSAKAAINALDVSGEGGTGLGSGRTIVMSHWPRTPLRGQEVVQQQRAFARRGRAFVWRAAHADDRVALDERRQDLRASALAPATE